MTGDPARRAVPVATAIGVAVALVATVYGVARGRAQGRQPAAVAPPAPAAALPRPGEAAEAVEIEGALTRSGFLITALDGRARALGLQVGDTLQAIGGQPVRSALQARNLARGAVLQLIRDGVPMTLQLGAAASLVPADVRTVDARGLTGQLTPEGLWVTAVDGEAAGWGVRPGDLIRSIDGNPLTVRREVATLLRQLDAQTSLGLEIVRNGARLFLPLGGAFGGQSPFGTPAPFGAPPPSPAPTAGGWLPAPEAQPTLPAAWGAAPDTPQGVACPSCGAWNNPAQPGAACWRCGASLGAGWR